MPASARVSTGATRSAVPIDSTTAEATACSVSRRSLSRIPRLARARNASDSTSSTAAVTTSAHLRSPSAAAAPRNITSASAGLRSAGSQASPGVGGTGAVSSRIMPITIPPETRGPAAIRPPCSARSTSISALRAVPSSRLVLTAARRRCAWSSRYFSSRASRRGAARSPRSSGCVEASRRNPSILTTRIDCSSVVRTSDHRLARSRRRSPSSGAAAIRSVSARSSTTASRW